MLNTGRIISVVDGCIKFVDCNEFCGTRYSPLNGQCLCRYS